MCDADWPLPLTPRTWQQDLAGWLKDRPDRHRLLSQHEALIADPAVLWAAQRISRSALGTRRKKPWSICAPVGLAASVAMAAVLVGLLPSGDVIVGQRGQSEAVSLADGSAVRLNGASRLRVRLDRDQRRLRLDGEGFFEVAHDKARPFIVETHGVRVTAVGTRFNVDSLETPEGAMVEVVVFEGVVDVASDQQIVRLHAGERARVKKGDVERVVLAQPEAETAFPSWTRGWLELDEVSLLSVIDDLERVTGVRVSLSDPRLGDALVSGRFSYEHPENALAAIARLHGLKLTSKATGQYVLSEA
ncbi:FecR family protein [Brevundimonas sp.]|uniref:FecR family protein n=1 Tax=Brevundimonas sp. TaxID=1871086 RepID=UPI003564F103